MRYVSIARGIKILQRLGRSIGDHMRADNWCWDIQAAVHCIFRSIPAHHADTQLLKLENVRRSLQSHYNYEFMLAMLWEDSKKLH